MNHYEATPEETPTPAASVESQPLAEPTLEGHQEAIVETNVPTQEEPQPIAEPVSEAVETPKVVVPEAIVEETAEVVSEAVETPKVVVPEAIVEETSEVVSEAVETPEIVVPEAIVEETPEVVSEAVETPEVVVPEAIVEETPEVISEAVEELLPEIDFASLSKEELVAALEQVHTKVKGEKPDFRAVDATLKEIKPHFDQIKIGERQEALQKFLADGGEEESFTYKADALTVKFDTLYGQIRTERNNHHQLIEKAREDNFLKKAQLLNRLREVVEASEQGGTTDKNWEAFKLIQTEWKLAGNIPSAFNNTLWDTYHALVERYFSNRNIYFELKELDRKRNMQHKIDLIEKVEKIVALVEEGEAVSSKTLDEANEIFEEFRHVGPAPKEANEVLWQRFKAALDTLYNRKRELSEVQKAAAEEVYRQKADIAAVVETFTSFRSGSINDWNDKTKALMVLQEQWSGIKGSLPRDKGKELNQKFWVDIKSFYKNKTEFFKVLEARRAESLKQKVAICEQIEGYVANEDDSSEATNTVIELQKQWRTVGHVPEKMREKIQERFKATCDAFFDRKRNKNAGVEAGYEANLTQKQTLCDTIEAEAKAGGGSPERLTALKNEFGAVGFVPRKDMQEIQKRYVAAVNGYLASLGKLSARERQELEASDERPRGGGGNYRNDRQANTAGGGANNDFRKKVKNLEDEIAQMENNLAFFARSKNAEKILSDFTKKIEKAKKDLAALLNSAK